MLRYDHARKAGNAGDLWKHYFLVSVVQRLLLDLPPDARFRYFETHAGRDRYRLSDTGTWHAGIGRVWPVTGVLADHPYFRLQGRDGGSGSPYLSSWALVGTYLHQSGRAGAFTLCELDPGIAMHLRRMPSVLLPAADLKFYYGDGFARLAEAREAPHLVLIDPSYSPDPGADWRAVGTAFELLEERGWPCLVWYPLLSGQPGPESLVASGWELRWSPPGAEPLWGAGILAGHLDEVTDTGFRNSLGRLADALGAELRMPAPAG